MRTLTYKRAHNLAALHEELLAAIPSLAPVVNDRGEKEAVLLLSGGVDNTIMVTVPDEIDDGAIRAVVNAHANPAPSAPPLSRDEKLASAIGEIRLEMEADPELKALDRGTRKAMAVMLDKLAAAIGANP